MIQLLASRYQKRIAYLLFLLFEGSFTFSSMAAPASAISEAVKSLSNPTRYGSLSNAGRYLANTSTATPVGAKKGSAIVKAKHRASSEKTNIGGPSQPEMSSFKAIDNKNMVNLFTGDFNYNIPLLDVGGYPVNIFYSGEVGMEQEASWVGLGWNINPGNINRNMRGIPDDFDGTEVLTQTQTTKPNKTWGVSVTGDWESFGYKSLNLGVNLGVSFNNYLGIGLDIGMKGGMAFKVAGKVVAEKEGDTSRSTLSIGGNIGLNANSREGVTFSPGISLVAGAFNKDRSTTASLGLSTSYNSRVGIKALQLSEQYSYNSHEEGKKPWRVNRSLYGTSISFARPSYIPSIRMPMLNSAIAGHFQPGIGEWGGFLSVDFEVYKQTSKVNPAKITQKKPMVGYLHYENAMKNADAVMDFSRLNDKEVTPHTPVISAPEYTYDVFSIQGEGTGGSIRAYRNDLGYVRDNYTSSQDNNTSLGGDLGLPSHIGFNVSTIHTPSHIGEWGDGNLLKNVLAFQGSPTNTSRENVYFRNPGENTVLDDNQFAKVGGVGLVRYVLGGSKYNPMVEPVLQKFTNEGAPVSGTITVSRDNATLRKRRTQVVSFLTAAEAKVVGLDRDIKSYNSYALLDSNMNLQFDKIDRVSSYRLDHHISEIDVTESNGKRYVYGIPVYNTSQKDMTFTVKSSNNTTPDQSDKIGYEQVESTTANEALNGDNTGGRDGYLQVTQTPAYAHSFLLSGLLSPDYVDLTGDGISDDDLGNAVKFNYSRMKQGNAWYDHNWRTPSDTMKANFNAGVRSNVKDDKGLVSFGQRESWYLHSIEAKTMIAVFTLGTRDDAKGPPDEYGGLNDLDTSSRLLKQIDLFSKADLKKNGMNAKPIKTVHFEYDYSLCQGAPDRRSGGKLTLTKIYFTYNGRTRQDKEQYVFSYTNSDNTGNPDYEFGGSDRWGSYKPSSMNPSGLRNSEYPYTLQDLAASSPKSSLDANAGAWALKRILLPSGGQLEVQYESDDYAYVQNKRATDFMNITGFGVDSLSKSASLYGVTGYSIGEKDYMYISVPQAVASKNDVLQMYLKGLDQIAVKLAVYMPSGLEYITAYTTYDNYGFTDPHTIWVHMVDVDGYSPLSLTALEYLREQLPKDAFPGYDVSESSGLQAVGEAFNGMWEGIKSTFSNVLSTLRSSGKAKNTLLSRCFARLDDPDGIKYGGGQRVHAVTLKDNWNAMKQGHTSSYTQVYDYTTTEMFNGVSRTISSGVASYEPVMGGDENPWQTIIRVENKLPLGPASYGAIENPIVDGLFQAPCVGYSKVTVRSIPSDKPTDITKKSRAEIGRQVTQFYTAKDFPVSYYYTPLVPTSDLQAHESQSTYFLYKYAFDSRALSQGFLVNLNDMHGKMLSQASYAANDTTQLVNFTQNFYRNTGGKGLDDKFSFVHASHGDTIENGNMGVDVELMTDTREFDVSSNSKELQYNSDLLPIFGVPVPMVWPVEGNSDNIYRAVTTTKIVNYHAVLDSVVVYDKGSQVSTKNLVYDGETGEVVVNRTNNEFDQPIYSTTYPAWWAYSGMGLAYQNIGMQFSGLNFYGGKIMDASVDQSVFESGDELYIQAFGTDTGCFATFASNSNLKVIWAFDLNKNVTSLTQLSHNFIFIDKDGVPYTNQGVSCKIIRSGKRNLLDAKAASITAMASPLVAFGSVTRLSVGTGSKVVNASAVNYREKWQAERDVIQTYATVYNSYDCSTTEVLDCGGHLEKSINPYRRGLLGNFLDEKDLVFYGGRMASDANGLSNNGYMDGFTPFWNFNVYNNLIPDTLNAQWLWKEKNTRVNSRGLQLETQNALGIYTAAQYGFNKNLPTAITSNAAYFESDYEGFEDHGYNNYLTSDSTFYCANQQHLALDSLPNSQVINTDGLTFQAHTGKYVLGVNPHSTAQKIIGVADTSNYDFGLNFTADTMRNLYQRGGTVTLASAIPGLVGDANLINNITNQTDFTGSGFTTEVTPLNNNTDINNSNGVSKTVTHSYIFSLTYYIQVPVTGDYTFQFGLSHEYAPSGSGDTYNVFYSFTDLDGNIQNSNGFTGSSKLITVHLCNRIYKVTVQVQNVFRLVTTYEFLEGSYEIFMNQNSSLLDYKTLTTQNGCIKTVPIAATEDMLQPSFSFHAGKKMLISAWVHEDSCGVAASGGPCNQVAFNNSSIVVNAGGADVTLVPAGPIIEGWQRREATIICGANGSSGYLSFNNTSDHTVYFDDIRLHPYNADMKSYVYDPVNLRLVAELDGNNYASFYEYDEEGTLVRTKAETREGIKTIKETRSAKQKSITTLQ